MSQTPKSPNPNTPKTTLSARRRRWAWYASLRNWVIVPFLILTGIIIAALASVTLLAGFIPVWLVLVTVVAFASAVSLGVLITRRLTDRIRRIIEASERVAQGDFESCIDDLNHDEIGHLAQSFNKMVSSLKHLHESRDLLSRTMSPSVRQSLIENGLDFRGITQTVSILFVDIRGFTRITELHDTERVVFFLNDYYTSVAVQVHSGGGIIGKFGGDSILAFFGAPDPQPNSQTSMRALLTALALQDTIAELSERWSLLGLPPIGVGMGLSIGEVVAGPIGSAEQFEYTVIGDAVNLASRLQSLTRSVNGFGIMLSSELYEVLDQSVKSQIQVFDPIAYESLSAVQQARQPVCFVDLGEVLVKGKKGPVHVYGIPDFSQPDFKD